MTDATVTFDLFNALKVPFDARRTKVWVTFNTDEGWIVDENGDVRMDAGTATITDAGHVTIAGIPIPGVDTNPTDFQIKVHFDAPFVLPGVRGLQRKTGDFGWMTVTADADLTDLIAEQYVPPTWISEAIASLEAIIADATTDFDDKLGQGQVLLDAQIALSGISTSDSAVAGLISNPVLGVLTGPALTALIDRRGGAAWATGTAYKWGRVVVNPSGIVVIANQDHTASASYATDAAKWDVATDVLFALNPTNGKRAIGKGELVLNLKDFGAKGDDSTDDTAAIQAWVDALIGGPSTDKVTRRSAKAIGYAPAGVYKITSDINFRGVTGLEIFGDGSDTTFFKAYGTAFSYGVLHFIGTSRLKTRGYKVIGDAAAQAPAGVAINYNPVVSALQAGDSANQIRFTDVMVGALDCIHNFDTGGSSLSYDVANVFFDTCLANGNSADSISTTGRTRNISAFHSGSGTAGNIVNHVFVNCTARYTEFGWKADAVDRLNLIACNATTNNRTIFHQGTTLLVAGLQVQNTERLLTTGGPGSATMTVELSGIQWGGQALHADGRAIEFRSPGALAISGSFFGYGTTNGVAPKVYVAHGSSRQTTVTLTGVTAANTPAGFIECTGTNSATGIYLGFVQSNTAGSSFAAGHPPQVIQYGTNKAQPGWKIDGLWDTGPLLMGGYYFWVDASGQLRLKSGAPASDSDGTALASASSVILTATKTTTATVNNSTTIVSDTELVVALQANSVYELGGYLRYDTSTVADFKLGINGPGGATASWGALGGSISMASGGSGSGNYLERSIGQTLGLGGGGSGTTVFARPIGRIVTGATAGNFNITFAQNTAEVSDTNLLPLSFITLRKIS